MKININAHGDYRVLRIEEELSVISDLSELVGLINGYLGQGKRYIAVGFTNTSYIYSGAVAVLINCLKEIKGKGGDLCIIEPNQDIADILHFLNIDKIMNIYHLENDLPMISQGEK